MLQIVRLLVILLITIPYMAIAGEEPQNSVEIYHYDGSLQCEPGSGTSLEEMGKTLESAGIEIISSRTGHDGRMYPAVCGAGTGRINIYEINAQQLKQAEALKFKPYQGMP